MSKETIEIPLKKATYEELQQVICELQLERYVKDKEIKRLNNIIENTIKKCVYLLENNEIEINNKKYYKQKCDDIITQFILQELKGSNDNDK